MVSSTVSRCWNPPSVSASTSWLFHTLLALRGKNTFSYLCGIYPLLISISAALPFCPQNSPVVHFEVFKFIKGIKNQIAPKFPVTVSSGKPGMRESSRLCSGSLTHVVLVTLKRRFRSAAGLNGSFSANSVLWTARRRAEWNNVWIGWATAVGLKTQTGLSICNQNHRRRVSPHSSSFLFHLKTGWNQYNFSPSFSKFLITIRTRVQRYTPWNSYSIHFLENKIWGDLCVPVGLHVDQMLFPRRSISFSHNGAHPH